MDEPTKNTAPARLPRLPRHYWTAERVSQVAAKYNSRAAFRQNDNGAYQAAQRLRITTQVCVHMERLCRAPWTLEEIIAIAKRYGTREHFKKSAGGAYMACHKRGWMDEVCAHMKKPKKDRKTKVG